MWVKVALTWLFDLNMITCGQPAAFLIIWSLVNFRRLIDLLAQELREGSFTYKLSAAVLLVIVGIIVGIVGVSPFYYQFYTHNGSAALTEEH